MLFIVKILYFYLLEKKLQYIVNTLTRSVAHITYQITAYKTN